MQTVAAGWLVYDLTHSAAAVGVLTLLGRGPSILVSSYGGELADRFSMRPLAVILFGLQIIPTSLIAVLVWDHASSPYEIYAVTLCVGVCGALVSPLVQQILTSTVPHELARKATGMGSVSYNMARLVGPAVGGLLVVEVGPGICFALNAASFVIAIAVLLSIRLPERSTHVTLRVREAIVEAAREPALRMFYFGTAVFSLAVTPIQELSPAIARRHGDGAHLLGFLLAALALGGFVGNYARSRLEERGAPPERLMAWAMIFSGATLLVLAFSESYPLDVAAMAVCGATWEVIFVVGLTGVQFVDPRASGLMSGLFFAVTMAGMTAGALLVGGVFDAVGIDLGLTACAGVVALGGLWLVAGRSRLHRQRAR